MRLAEKNRKKFDDAAKFFKNYSDFFATQFAFVFRVSNFSIFCKTYFGSLMNDEILALVAEVLKLAHYCFAHLDSLVAQFSVGHLVSIRDSETEKVHFVTLYSFAQD